MKFTDILELAKQGYTPADIKELLSININEQEQTPATIQGDIKQEEVVESEPATPVTKPTEKVMDAKPNDVDYRKLYEEAQSKLEKVQKQNITQNIKDDTVSDESTLADIVRSFM